MRKEQESIIDMAKYAESEEIHEKCNGCNKVFDYTPVGGEITSQKCLTYSHPSAWWKDKPIAMKKELIVNKTNPKGIWVEMPAVVRMCPVATHVKVEKTVEGIQVNPLKAAKRAQRGG